MFVTKRSQRYNMRIARVFFSPQNSIWFHNKLVVSQLHCFHCSHVHVPFGCSNCSDVFLRLSSYWNPVPIGDDILQSWTQNGIKTLGLKLCTPINRIKCWYTERWLTTRYVCVFFVCNGTDGSLLVQWKHSVSWIHLRQEINFNQFLTSNLRLLGRSLKICKFR